MNTSFDRSECKEEWFTPPYIIKALGEFDLDPCTSVNRPFDTAKRHFTPIDNGLLQDWGGQDIRVWCNPPYGNKTKLWLNRCVLHGNCIVLIFARTETNMFFDYIWNKADAIMFLKGRLKFYHISGKEGGTAGSPSILIAYGYQNALSLLHSNLDGRFIWLK